MAQSQPPSATINGPGQKIVRSVAKAYLDGQPSHHYSRITVTGHTDASHAGNFNIPLSLQRAGVVRDALVALGVPRAAITIVAVGKNKPLVQTADGVREPQKWRAEIVLQ